MQDAGLQLPQSEMNIYNGGAGSTTPLCHLAPDAPAVPPPAAEQPCNAEIEVDGPARAGHSAAVSLVTHGPAVAVASQQQRQQQQAFAQEGSSSSEVIFQAYHNSPGGPAVASPYDDSSGDIAALPSSSATESDSTKFNTNSNNVLSHPPPLIQADSSELDAYQHLHHCRQQQQHSSLDHSSLLDQSHYTYTKPLSHVGPGPSLLPLPQRQPPRLIPTQSLQLKTEPQPHPQPQPSLLTQLWHPPPNLSDVPWPLPPNPSISTDRDRKQIIPIVSSKAGESSSSCTVTASSGDGDGFHRPPSPVSPSQPSSSTCGKFLRDSVNSADLTKVELKIHSLQECINFLKCRIIIKKQQH